MELIVFSFQKESNNEDINAILDKLIQQTEGTKDNSTKGTSFDDKAKSANDSKIIYVKTNMKLDRLPNITGNLKDPNNRNAEGPSNYDSISEELVLEIEAPTDNVKNEPTFTVLDFKPLDNRDEDKRSAYPDDYLENDSAPDETLDSYVPKIQQQPDILSRYPAILSDPESNSNKHAKDNNDVVKNMLLDLLEHNDQVNEESIVPDSQNRKPEDYDRPNYYNNNKKGLGDIILSRFINNGPGQVLDILGMENPQVNKRIPPIWNNPFQPPAAIEYPRNKYLDNLATLNMNTAIKHSLWYQNYLNSLPPMEFAPNGFPVPSYQMPPRVRAVYHHPAPIMPIEPEWPTGIRCCGY